MSMRSILLVALSTWVEFIATAQTSPVLSEGSGGFSLQQVIDAAFPLEAQEMGIFALGFRSYQLNPGDLSDDVEFSAVFEWVRTPNANGTIAFGLVATVTSAIERPVSYQILESWPEETTFMEPIAVVQALRLEKWRISEETCPDIREALRGFENLDVPSMLFEYLETDDGVRMPVISIHPTTNEIIASRLGLSMALTFQEHQFTQGSNWIRQTRMLLDLCIENSLLP